MIRGVRANKAGFKEVKFFDGLNLVVADRNQEATDRDTTNALGKSTLIEIIDFCLGSNPSANEGVRVASLADWAFTLDLDINGKPTSVTRSPGMPSHVSIEGNTEGWPEQPELDKAGTKSLRIQQWRAVLGWAFFHLAPNEASDGLRPSSRSLLSYFLRSGPAAFLSPFKYFDNQNVGSVQLHSAFLLGLDWQKAASWQRLKDQRKALSALKAAIKTGAIDGELSSLGELEAERVRLEQQSEKERSALSSFQVHHQYRDIEVEANRLTGEIHERLNANVVDQRRLSRYVQATEIENSPTDTRVEDLYRRVGIELPGAAVRTLEEARAFNRAIAENRKKFIASEIDSLRQQVEQRTGEVAALTSQRAELLSLLSGHGALEELTRLQELHSQTRGRLESLLARIAQLKQMTSKSDEVKVKEIDLRRSTEIDYEERRSNWTKAISLFAEYSNALYNTPGSLVIDIADTGYQFKVDMSGGPSEGISKMKIFCYDLMLITLAKVRGLGIDFLVHDSTIFDGVDSRQRAHALELAATVSKQYGFQYICALNSDMIPENDLSPEFELASFVRLRLTDTDPSGSLLGFRY